jgi:hypothetical protein
MTIIEVEAIMVDADGQDEDVFGGETGTPEFYQVTYTLQQHLGEETKELLFYNHESRDTFIIETKAAANKNLINHYINIIQTIHEPFDIGFNQEFYQDRRLRFNIIQVE